MRNRISHLLTDEREFFRGPELADPAVDTTRRVVRPGDDFYRFGWEVQYRNGTVRRQYERRGDAVLQTLFAKLPAKGVRVLSIFDFASNPPALMAVIDQIPEDAECEVYYTCSVPLGLSGQTTRIYNFGFKRPNGERSYLHLDPSTDPVRAWADTRR